MNTIKVSFETFNQILDEKIQIFNSSKKIAKGHFFYFTDGSGRFLNVEVKECFTYTKYFFNKYYLFRFELTGMMIVNGLEVAISSKEKNHIYSKDECIRLDLPKIHKTNGRGSVKKTFELKSLDTTSMELFIVQKDETKNTSLHYNLIPEINLDGIS
jgi:hypothetical protein